MQPRSSSTTSALSRGLSAGSGTQERKTRNEEGNLRVYVTINTTQEERAKSRVGEGGMLPGNRPLHVCGVRECMRTSSQPPSLPFTSAI